jgi:hypothetical protein
LEQQADGWAIWVCDDSDATWAKKEWEVFALDPNDARFSPPLSSPESVLDQMRPAERQIVAMHLQGSTTSQIAARLNLYERKVRRVLESFKARFEQQQWLPGHSSGAAT